MYYSTILSFVASTEQKAAAMATLYVLFQPVIVVNMSQNVTEFSLSESCPSLASAQGIRFQFPLLNQWILSTQPLIPQSPRTIDFFYCHPKWAALCFSLFLILFSGSSVSQNPPQQPGTPNLLPKALLLSLASYDTRNQIANKGTQKP